MDHQTVTLIKNSQQPIIKHIDQTTIATNLEICEVV